MTISEFARSVTFFSISKIFPTIWVLEQGDSRSPIWQYQRGQAVIVGVMGGFLNSSAVCQDERWVIVANDTG